MSILRRAFLFALALVAASATLEANCTWQLNPPALQFGNYSVFATGDLTAITTFEVRCTGGDTATVALNIGTGGGSFLTGRLMTLAANTLSYNLYLDAAGSQIWGDGSPGTFVFQATTPSNQPHVFTVTIYGHIPAGLDPFVGNNYQSTVTATLSFLQGGGPTTRNFNVQANVLRECRSNNVSLSFGAYDPVVANAITPKDQATTLPVFCTRGVGANVGLNPGNNPQGGNRRMISPGSEFLGYDLYRVSCCASQWTLAQQVSATSTSKDTALPLTVFGRIFPGQDISVGDYSDTVQAVINY